MDGGDDGAALSGLRFRLLRRDLELDRAQLQLLPKDSRAQNEIAGASRARPALLTGPGAVGKFGIESAGGGQVRRQRELGVTRQARQFRHGRLLDDQGQVVLLKTQEVGDAAAQGQFTVLRARQSRWESSCACQRYWAVQFAASRKVSGMMMS